MSWKTDFYPITLEANDYLSYYSNRFDFVEVNLGDGTGRMNADSTRVDSTYGFLSKYARVCSEQTPDDFHFAIRIPKAILFPTPDGTSNLAGGSISRQD